MLDKKRTKQRRELPPLLVTIDEVEELLSYSQRSIDRLKNSGGIPAPIMLNGSKRWRYYELKAWIRAGCPPRAEWDAVGWKRVATPSDAPAINGHDAVPGGAYGDY